ncbi:hypothetical protein X777_09078, partial [Ooceraea biroi]
NLLSDVPDPPERPLVISYTSKAVNISWAPGVNSHNTPISQYVIYTRSWPDYLMVAAAVSDSRTSRGGSLLSLATLGPLTSRPTPTFPLLLL